MLRIKNLTNSPYPVMLVDGSKVLLPARGMLENVDVHPLHLPLYRAIGYIQINEMEGASPEVEKLDDPDKELTILRNQYTEVSGKKPYHGWDAAELTKRINKAKG